MTDHARRNVPGCRACTDPAQLPGWLASERARADDLGRQSRAVRAEAEEADAAVRAAGWQELAAAQAEQQFLHGTANALAQRALNIRAHADRVEAAHPAEPAVATLPGLELVGGAP